jgi:hypothetical protein
LVGLIATRKVAADTRRGPAAGTRAPPADLGALPAEAALLEAALLRGAAALPAEEMAGGFPGVIMRLTP